MKSNRKIRPLLPAATTAALLCICIVFSSVSAAGTQPAVAQVTAAPAPAAVETTAAAPSIEVELLAAQEETPFPATVLAQPAQPLPISQEDLRQMGFYLGKFIYLMDALEDLPKDRKKNNYNLFLDCGDVFDGNEEPKYRKMLTDVLAESARAFERLPILEYAGILRNVLYSGVWGRYVLIRQTHDEKMQKNRNRNEET